MAYQSFRIWFSVGLGLVSITVARRQWRIRRQSKKQFLSKDQKEDVEKGLITVDEHLDKIVQLPILSRCWDSILTTYRYVGFKFGKLHDTCASSSVDRLDNDLIAEVLVRLPVKSLVRFRCVSKSWHALICSDPYFAKKLEAKGSYKILETVSPIRSKDLRDSRVGKTILTKQRYKVLGSCSGLICIEDTNIDRMGKWIQKDRQLMLLNPSTRDKYKLPKHTISFCTFYGFAYDSTLEDYKVVLGYNSSENYPSVTIEVFSLKTEAWKTTTLKNVEKCFGQGKLLSGTLHWLTRSRSDTIVTIVSFNVTEEKFGQFMPPPNISASQDIGIGTTIGNCRLFLYEYDSDCHRSNIGIAFTIWVMEEYGMSESWTRHVQVPSLSLSLYNRYRCYTPYWILENGEVLMERRGKRSKTMQLVSYNPEDNSQKSYSRCVLSCNMSPLLYMETLVLPKPPSPSGFRPWKNICNFLGLFRWRKETIDNSTCQDQEKIVELPEAPVESQTCNQDRYVYCVICRMSGCHETTMCPNRSQGYSTLCRICDDGLCENEAEHKDEHFELLKYCQYCDREGNHWEDDCPYEFDSDYEPVM